MAVALKSKNVHGCKCCNPYFDSSKLRSKLRRKNRRTSKMNLKESSHDLY